MSSLLRSLIEAGFTLNADGERLIVSPAAAITDQVRRLIRDNKAEILAEVRAAEVLSLHLLAAIARCCSARGDTDANRAALIDECTALDPQAQEEMRRHFDAEADRFTEKRT